MPKAKSSEKTVKRLVVENAADLRAGARVYKDLVTSRSTLINVDANGAGKDRYSFNDDAAHTGYDCRTSY